jgi:hypothetical protein
VNALNDYYSDNQHFPENLDELIPKYLNKIPPTSLNYSILLRSIFVYRSYTRQTDTYVIEFYDASEKKWYSYSSSENKYKTTTKDIPENTVILDEIVKGQVNTIISALEKYYENNHFYPQSLTKLEPDYIDNIPFNINDTKYKELFSYTIIKDKPPMQNNVFELFFKYNLFYGYSYYSIYKKWKYFSTLI